ncbi:MAG: UDP-N-acetylmuramoyl-L-alanine--D-glutamate ligase [Roseburia sp.]|nr:UDP-N-acetylmuramoyl-L-alanine--D-glutamate ligase [Anaeroplasma bactoclasticum]MCM1197201.1 UDP-N-acetylmuramoyl-L-alanine--D-glutamate ligase [Roseburia sp.]MCM1557829.1 UDP-N-acetylmuramoyl-L-alanine--D-glutamate ligase [Anaeroplasma bactoclasticum]
MKTLVLGKGIANDGVVLLLEEEQIEFDYLNLDEVESFNYDLVVKAPGIVMSEKIIQTFLEKKIRVITDVELAFMLRKKFYIGVTGSNGKTTTVSLITHILSAKYDVVACGNIGYSVCRAVVEHPNADIFVVECSSFQLETSKIDCNISVLLNVHPCHLDHHNSYKDYIESKTNICINQSSSHYCIYHLDDPIVKGAVKSIDALKISFSKTSYLAKCYIYDGFIYINKKRMIKIEQELKLKPFLLEDVMASICAASLVKGITPKIIKERLKTFEEVEYRLTKINDFIYNDAKSTNPYSTLAALECFDMVELVCGGYDRKENLACLQSALPKLKRVYAYGQTKEKVKTYMEENYIECLTFNSLDEAFTRAYQDRKEEVILFSPMFASFDSFKNYIERGKYFNEIAMKIIEQV